MTGDIEVGDIVLLAGRAVEHKIVLITGRGRCSEFFLLAEDDRWVLRFRDYGLDGFVMEEDCEVVSDADIVAARLRGIPLWVGVEYALKEKGRL